MNEMELAIVVLNCFNSIDQYGIRIYIYIYNHIYIYIRLEKRKVVVCCVTGDAGDHSVRKPTCDRALFC